MKFFTTLLFLFTFTLLVSCKPTEIAVTIHFKNAENLNFTKGKITVKETNQTFEISTLEDFTIMLKKGKYTIQFSQNGNHQTSITKKITEKDFTFNFSVFHAKAIELKPKFSEENLKKQIESGKANFINFGITIADFSEFQKKYGIGNSGQGCMITPDLSYTATQNNQYLAKYLDEKYGEIWRKDLPFLPYSLVEKEN